MTVVSVENVSVQFRPQKHSLLLRQRIRNLFKEDRTEMFYALRDVSFTAQQGECVAILGQNGAGKSTLLSTLAGVLMPDAGRVRVRGRVGALLELGTGFHPDLTGRENLALNGALMGLTREELDERSPSILDFSEIGSFIDEPLKNYSAGMRLRLAFSIAVHVDCSVMLLDEVLAVGDTAFANKCIVKVHELKAKGRMLVYVTHSLDSVHEICSRAIWLHCGRVMQDGPVAEVVGAYADFMADPHRRFRDPAAAVE